MVRIEDLDTGVSEQSFNRKEDLAKRSAKSKFGVKLTTKLALILEEIEGPNSPIFLGVVLR
ncbi:hypothetical protein L484_015834 [Morus notabilis]|uniref:Uncharacterized protein n=1 Tax=Morus notabilis TaxID=981085 RepID=W9RLS3_9ROSA|nr:hypothetical protein L484_015834 [Morus notabilis]